MNRDACVYYKETMCEIEPIGPMETIDPGKEISYAEYWYLFDYQYPDEGNADLADIQNKIEMLEPKFNAPDWPLYQ